MQNLNLIEIKTLPATKTKKQRIKLTSYRLKESKTINIEEMEGSILEIATKLLETHLTENEIVGVGMSKNGYTFAIGARKSHTFQRLTEMTNNA